MGQDSTFYNAFRDGCSFCYRDIFSGLSNEKMGPVPFMPIGAGFPVFVNDFPLNAYFATILFFLWITSPVLSLGGQQPPFWEAFRRLPIFLCLLRGNSLVLLKTNFAKKPKNPV